VGKSTPRELRRAVLLTGASRGIGEACALRLDELGFAVCAGVRRAADGEALRRKGSPGLTPVILDVADAASIASAAAAVAGIVGEAGLAGLVNNAGISIAGPLEFLSLGQLRDQFEVNVIGLVAVTQAFLPLVRQGSGRIVNMASMEGRVAMPFVGPYCASKFAVEALTNSLRMELESWSIPVSVIEPGIVATSLMERSLEAAEEAGKELPERAHELYDPAIAAAREAADRLGRHTVPVELVVRAVVHALTARKPKARYVVGQDARFMEFLSRLLPDRLCNWIILRQMGLPTRPLYS